VLEQLRISGLINQTRVIMLASIATTALVDRCYELGAIGYVREPKDIEDYCAEVRAAVDRWLAAGQPLLSQVEDTYKLE
jgi:DNA-binding NarL/FixJ family response regulator